MSNNEETNKTNKLVDEETLDILDQLSKDEIEEESILEEDNEEENIEEEDKQKINKNIKNVVNEENTLDNKTAPELDKINKTGYLENNPYKETKKVSDKLVNLPPTTIKNITKIIEYYGDKKDLTEKEMEWIQSLIESIKLTFTEDALNKALTEDEWEQKIEYKGKDLQIKEPAIKEIKNKKLSGDSAVLYSMTKLGLGSIVHIPLWHSGFWISIKAPSETDLLNLFINISKEKTELGRSTYGVIFSNTSVILTRLLSEFIIENIHNTSLEITSDMNLLDYINYQDFYPMVLGLISSMHSKGFDFSRPCINIEENCTYVAKGKIDPRKLLWVNKNALNEDHKLHMSKRRNKSHKLEYIKRYQDSLHKLSSKTIKLKTNEDQIVEITLKNPTLSEYIDNGEEWINSIIEMVEGLVEEDDNKENFIQKHSELVEMRKFSHFVESIEIDSVLIEDKVTKNRILDLLSSDTELVENFNKKILEFINESMISIVGIPDYNCPKCNKPQLENHKTSIIALDSLSNFFILADQRIG